MSIELQFTETVGMIGREDDSGAWGLPKLAMPGFAMIASNLSGCSSASAPAAVVFGSYFPEWLIFAIIAVVAAVVVRLATVFTGYADRIPFPLFTCLAVGILLAGAVDFIWLGR
jgi:hypothetical protein